jgi:hypothetical protein
MATQTIKGHSDDLLIFEGPIRDEMGCFDCQPTCELQDGTEIVFTYDDDGLWRAKVQKEGTVYNINIVEGKAEDDEGDTVYIEGGRVDYVIGYTDDRNDAKIYGEFALNQDHQKIFDSLINLFSDCDEFQERQGTVKAILMGVVTL